MPHDNDHPEGYHDATITSHAFTEHKGKDRITFHVRTEHGDLRFDLYLTEAAAKFTAEKLQAIGFRGYSFADLDDQPLVGAPCRVKVTRNGEYVNADLVTSRSDEDVKARARRFDRFLLPPSESRRPQPAPRDEVPF